MNLSSISLCSLFLALLAAAPAAAQNEQPTPEQIAEFQKLAEPGEHHKHLGVLEGKWALTLTSEGAPGGEATETKGKANYRWILGNRYLVEEVETEFFGQKMEWMGIYGYSNIEKKYTGTWHDNFGTDTERGEGQCSDDGKVISFDGEMPNPMGEGKQTFKWVINLKEKDKMSITMYMPGPDGKDAKMLEIAGTREK